MGTGYPLKIAKINPQQEKPICCVLMAKITSSRKTQKIANRAKINSRKNFVPHVSSLKRLSLDPIDRSRFEHLM